MDLTARLELLRGFLTGHLPIWVALHLAVLSLLAVLCAPQLSEPFRRATRAQKLLLLGLMVMAFLVRALAIPALTRHLYDGHEADYYDVWRGVRQGLEVGYRASEFVRQVYRWVGPLFHGSGQALVVLQLLFSVLAIPFAWLWVRELTGSDRAGLWACWFVAVDPVLSFWASSAYNIQQPVLLSLMALAVLERAMRRGSALGLALALVLWATAVATRTEALLMGVPIAWRGAQRGRVLGANRAWIPAVVLPLVLVAVALLAGARANVGGDSNRYLWSMFRRHVGYLEVFAPYDRWIAVAVLVVAAVAVWRRAAAARALLPYLAAIVLVHHLAYAAFDDYDARHTLPARLAIAALLGTALASSDPARRTGSAPVVGLYPDLLDAAGRLVLGATVTVLLLLGVRDVSTRYYATAKQFYRDEPRFRSAPEIGLDPWLGCVFVAESEYYRSYHRASHFELFDLQKLAGLRSRYPCILFVYDLENYQASSRSIHGRALKVARFFELEPIGAHVNRRAESYALIYRIVGPRGSSPRKKKAWLWYPDT